MARSSAALAPPRASNGSSDAKTVRCAIYTRKSTEEGLQQEFNSLDAQREASEAFIASQKHEGWQVIPDHFDDGGYTGGNMDRPALKRLLAAVEARSVDCIVVYKVDRLSRSAGGRSALRVGRAAHSRLGCGADVREHGDCGHQRATADIEEMTKLLRTVAEIRLEP
jgi:hypothetical protein